MFETIDQKYEKNSDPKKNALPWSNMSTKQRPGDFNQIVYPVWINKSCFMTVTLLSLEKQPFIVHSQHRNLK